MQIEIIKDNNQYNEQIKHVVTSAFKQDNEAILVEKIKEESDYYVSYLAIDKEKDMVVGHVMISPMILNGVSNVLCLAPVSVLSEYENHGIGSQLIKQAISEASKNENYDIITVLGSDHYYNRFGFEGYDTNKFVLPFEVEPRFFQIMELKDDCLKSLTGTFDYPHYFGN
ncbi:N-acetyltransferase [Erysipelotrichaceae bacterium OttesenSCG-928-M19]|nr:N-acetyltransferase [Erysipelotrichaceae bacterium OttesenSCG-928-M19]